MDDRTRRQLHALSLAFYASQAEAFDASRVDLPWPGWERVLAALPDGAISVLDIGCGNGRFAAFLHARGRSFDYLGTDANAALIEAARARLGEALGGQARFALHDFLADGAGVQAGADLPGGPFSLVVLMGVLHHVPGAETRLALLRQAAVRLTEGGCLALATWQFAGQPRFERRSVPWSEIGPVLGAPIDPTRLEPGDRLLRFGDDPSAPPRYCHQVSDEEFASWPAALGLEAVETFRADGAQGDLNRYWVLRRS